jgi:hypothetical protein
MKRTHYQLTFTDNFLTEKHDVPREAIRPLFRYLRRHAHLPFIVAGAIFLRHWRMGVNLMLQPDPREAAPQA